MLVGACACGDDHLTELNQNELTTWDAKMTKLMGVCFAGYQSVEV